MSAIQLFLCIMIHYIEAMFYIAFSANAIVLQ